MNVPRVPFLRGLLLDVAVICARLFFTCPGALLRAAADLPLAVDRPLLAVAARRRPVVLPAARSVALRPVG